MLKFKLQRQVLDQGVGVGLIFSLKNGWLAAFLSSFTYLVIVSCSSSTATPPTAPAELPSITSFPFPSSIGIDVDEITTSESSEPVDIPSPIAKTESRRRTVGSGGEYSDEIVIGSNMAEEVAEELNGILEIFEEVDVPVGTDETNFETTVTDDEDETHAVKMDFAVFDFGGDGTDESCSGHTAALPICFRVWLDNERFMAGLFDTYPSDDNPGAGQMRVVDLLDSGTDFEENSSEGGSAIAAVYDLDDAENTSTDLQSIIPSADSTEYRQISLTEVGPEGSAKKTLNVTSRLLGTVSYLGQWIEDNDYWTGHILIDENGVSDEAIPCAQISTGNGADKALCEALGLSIDGISFNELPTATDVSLPDDFPDAPTF